MRAFVLKRTTDASGVSGTGIVAEGVQFSSGKVALSWRTAVTSIGVYDSIEDAQAIHGHNGQTVVVWINLSSVETDKFERFVGKS